MPDPITPGVRAARRALWGAAGAAFACLAVVLLAACGAEPEATAPVECMRGPAALRRALEEAPSAVTLRGTPLSECLATANDQADIQAVGAAFVDVATDLASAARARPGGPQALRLGYLVAAARRGAERTPGIHDELVRRLEQELTGVDTSSAAYRRGEEAGRTLG